MATLPLLTPPIGAAGAAIAPSRNIVICLDGTGNQFSARNSNVIKLMSVLRVDETQLVYYSSGLGTVLPDSFSSSEHIKNQAAKIIDMGLALNFDNFVCEAYQYLMDNYRAGDKVYLFGFSRGAYTARALAGMIQKVGLLSPGNHNQIKLAYEVYSNPAKYEKEFKDIKTTDAHGHKHTRDPAILYRRIFGISRHVTIEYLGVWDTVSSLTAYGVAGLPFARDASTVNIYRQALALDERRARFPPEYRAIDKPEQALLSGLSAAQADLLRGVKDAAARVEKAKQELVAKEYPFEVVVNGHKMYKRREVWFMGCHSDVGGGNELNDEPALANVAFRCNLLLDASGVALMTALSLDTELDRRGNDTPVATLKAKTGIKDSTIAALKDLTHTLEEHADTTCAPTLELDHTNHLNQLLGQLKQPQMAQIVELAAAFDSAPLVGNGANEDVMSNLHESLTSQWQILEHIPFITRGTTTKGVDVEQLKFNNGEGRQMAPFQQLHRSVLRRFSVERTNKTASFLQRISDELTNKGPYKPAAKVPAGWPAWADLMSGYKQLPDEFVED